MSVTATAQAKTTEPKHPFTGFELWQVVEEFGLTLYPPRVGGGAWFVVGVGEGDRFLYENGETAIGAVENFLRRIGGGNG